MATLDELRGGDNIIYPNVDGASSVSSVNGIGGAINLVAGPGIDIAVADPNITISNTAATATLTRAGGTETLVNDGVGPTFATKGLTAGAGISLSSDANSVTITNSEPASAATLTSVGLGLSLIKDGTGPDFDIRQLQGGTGITLSFPDPDTIEIAQSSAGKSYIGAISSGVTNAPGGGVPDIVTVNGGSAYDSSDWSVQASGEDIRNDSGRTVRCEIHWRCSFQLNAAGGPGVVQVKCLINGVSLGPTTFVGYGSTVGQEYNGAVAWIASVPDTQTIRIEVAAPDALDYQQTSIHVFEL